MKIQTSIAAGFCAIAITALIAGCGGSNNSNNGPRIVSTISVPNSASPPFNFDISYADSGKYYLADRNNSAVDVVDTKTAFQGPPIGTDTTGQGQEGPHCQ